MTVTGSGLSSIQIGHSHVRGNRTGDRDLERTGDRMGDRDLERTGDRTGERDLERTGDRDLLLLRARSLHILPFSYTSACLQQNEIHPNTQDALFLHRPLRVIKSH